MLSNESMQVKCLLHVAELFGADYIRSHKETACTSFCTDFDDEAEMFFGFSGDLDKNTWTEYAFVAINKYSGVVRFLDYRLPSGFRMKNPPKKVIYS